MSKELTEAKKIQETNPCFTAFCDDMSYGKGTLSGIAFSIKDNVWVKGVQSCAASSILAPFKPLEDATVVKRLREAGAGILGKTVMDEFGFGSHNLNLTKKFSPPKNPLDNDVSCGGSSGGAAVFTAIAPFPHVALAESTGGSIESPAASCGVIGYCPTYGLLSRYGLISYADSFDKLGFMAKTVAEIEPALKAVAGHDPKDATSLRENADWGKSKEFSIVYPKEALADVDDAVKKSFTDFLAKAKTAGIPVKEISLPITFTHGVAAYYLLVTAEASTNLARLCGLRYGHQEPLKGVSYDEYFAHVREQFSNESKRRILLGTYARMEGYRDQYYLKAAQARTLIIKEFSDALAAKNAVLVLPTLPTLPPKLSDIAKMTPAQIYQGDCLSVGTNLAGVPHASIPVAKHGKLSLSITASTAHLREGLLISFLEKVEEIR